MKEKKRNGCLRGGGRKGFRNGDKGENQRFQGQLGRRPRGEKGKEGEGRLAGKPGQGAMGSGGTWEEKGSDKKDLEVHREDAQQRAAH